MKKATKYINARYNIDTGKWAIRDNGEVLKSGQGVVDYAQAFKEIEKTATKKIVEKLIF
jgi:DNA-directed RNA polymerase subunit F